jgi:hypothetical protein
MLTRAHIVIHSKYARARRAFLRIFWAFPLETRATAG